MAHYQVTAPVADYTGEVGTVQFVDGRAVVDEETDAATLAYCVAAGYDVVPVDGEATEEEVPKPARRTRSSKETNA